MARQKKQTKESIPLQSEGGLDELKAKLRKKFYLLKDDALNCDTKEALLSYVSSVLGMGMGELRSKLVDL
jgi:Ca2+-dependent lipid-binding protein